MYEERPASRWDFVDRHTDNDSLIRASVLILVLVIVGGVVWFFTDDNELDTHAYQNVVVDHADLPAPPFVGWTREELDSPLPASSFAVTEAWDQEDCRPDASGYKELDSVMTSGKALSGAKFYNAALDNTITVQLTSSHDGSFAGTSSLGAECDAMNGVDGDREYTGSIQVMPDVNFQKLGFSTGTEWITEHSVYNGDDLEESRSTAVVLASYGQTKVQVSISIPGPMENNALRSLGLVLQMQAAKIRAMSDEDAAESPATSTD